VQVLILIRCFRCAKSTTLLLQSMTNHVVILLAEYVELIISLVYINSSYWLMLIELISVYFNL